MQKDRQTVTDRNRASRPMTRGRLRGHPKGFTLVELLMVIAIIALLVTILMPSLQRARELARSAVCKSNQRNCGLAFLLYSTDWNGRMMSFWENAGGGITLWPCLLSGEPERFARDHGDYQYLSPGGIFGCPSNNAYPYDLDRWYGKSNYSFGMYVAGWEHKHVFGWSFSENILFNPPSYKPQCQVHWLQAVPNPASIVWMGDSASARNWEGGLPAAAGRMIACFNPYVESMWQGRIHLVHHGAANVLFYDGHVEILGSEELFDSDSNIRVFYDQDMTPLDL